MDLIKEYSKALPPVSTVFALIQIGLYPIYSGTQLGLPKDNSNVSKWRVLWLISLGPYIHFGFFSLIVNLCLLILAGRYLEEKFTKSAMTGILLFLGVISNVIYLLLNSYVCQYPVMHACGFGLSKTLLGLKFIGTPTYFYELYPDYPSEGSPWAVLLDIVIQVIIIPDICIGGFLAALLSGLLTSLLLALASPLKSKIIRDKLRSDSL